VVRCSNWRGGINWKEGARETLQGSALAWTATDLRERGASCVHIRPERRLRTRGGLFAGFGAPWLQSFAFQVHFFPLSGKATLTLMPDMPFIIPMTKWCCSGKRRKWDGTYLVGDTVTELNWLAGLLWFFTFSRLTAAPSTDWRSRSDGQSFLFRTSCKLHLAGETKQGFTLKTGPG